MNILLTGANGFIGHHLLTKLSQLDYSVTACVRKKPEDNPYSPKVKFIDVNFIKMTEQDDWKSIFDKINFDIVINAVGIIAETKQQPFSVIHTDTPSALFSGSDKAGVKKVIQISALGADEKATSQYHLSKLAADDVLSSLSLNWCILRPSLVYGTGAKSMALFRAMSALPITALIEGGTQKMQPVYIDDLVDVVLRCVENDSQQNQVIDVVGPDEITMKALLQKQRNWLGLSTAKEISVPLKWMLKLMPIMGWLNEPALTAESLKMLQRGNIADASMMTEALGKVPEAMDSVLLRHPATSADIWDARLYFMKALMRLGVWVLAPMILAWWVIVSFT